MKILINLIILFFVFFFSVFGNGVPSDTIVNKPVEGDTSFWYKRQLEVEKKMNLLPLISDTNDYHIRFWNGYQIVDIWTVDYQTYHGAYYSYTETYQPLTLDKKREKKSKFYYKKTEMDSVIAYEIYCESIKIDTIPTDSSIQGWYQGEDGITYTLGFSNSKQQQYKVYWTPSAQDTTIVQAKLIITFVDYLNAKLLLHRDYNDLISTMKPGSYTNGYTVATLESKRQVRKHNRTVEKYREDWIYMMSMEDSITTYIEDSLTKMFQELPDYDYSFHNFQVFFNSNNEVRKIRFRNTKVAMGNYNYHSKVIKKEMKAYLEKLDLSFINSDINYCFKISWYNKKAYVSKMTLEGENKLSIRYR